MVSQPWLNNNSPITGDAKKPISPAMGERHERNLEYIYYVKEDTMKNCLLLLLALLLTSSITYAKKEGNTLSGKILDKAQEPLVAANVVILQEGNILVKAELTDAQGMFSITDIPAGEYMLKVMLTGFETYMQEKLAVVGNTTLPDIVLHEKSSQLKEVSVRAQKPLVEAFADKLVVNLENSIVNAGSTVMEVLQRAPNVTVDQNDNISMKGRQGVTIMINGKIVPVQGSDLANVLKGMPAGSVEKIELISNPGARYDAAGTGGIINIKLKKDTRMGANGNINWGYTQGIYPKHNGGIGLNFRNKKITLYSSYNGNERYGMNWLDLERRFVTNGIADTVYRQHNYAYVMYRAHVANLGVDYNISPKTTVGVVLNGAVNRNDFLGDNRSDVLDENRQQVSYFNTISNNISRWKSFSSNLNFRHTLDSAGKELSVDGDYAYYTLRTDQDVTTDYRYMNGDVIREPNILLGEAKGHTDIKSVKADYVHPINQSTKLEAGVKTSFVVADNAPVFFNKIDDAISFDSTKSNHFVYNENINAAYINASKEWEKWSLQLGLRAEQTRIKGEEKLTDTSFTKEYAQLFPSMGLVRHVNKNNDLGVTLSRRIDRPNYRQLNPFRSYLDLSTIHQGNPNLNPSLTYSVEMNHIYKGKFMTSFSFSRTTDVITEVIKPGTGDGGTKVTVITDDNLATNYVYSLSGAYPLQFTKWWNSTNSFNLYHSYFEGNLVNTPLAAGTTAFQLSTNNNFILPRDWSAEVSCWYQSGQQYAFMYLEAMYAINLGVQKMFWDRKASVRLAVNDILWKQNPRGSNSFTTYNEDFIVKRDSRVVSLNFTYRFGKKTVAPVRRRTGGAEDEKRRAASGG